ncbi:MAG: RNA polymerase sigma factor [Candidatus Binatia bacterium]
MLAVGQVAVDEAASYDDIYRTHRARVVRLCHLLLSDPDEAQEVSQEVFLKLHRAHQAVGAPPNWGPWLSTVTVNACRDRRRSRWWKWGRRSEEYDDEAHASAALTPEQAALDQETRQRIWLAFRALPARQREVFALRHLEGWSTEAVAETLQLSSGTVKQHLFRAVQHMRRALGGQR